MNLKSLLDAGATVIIAPTVRPDRSKVCGRMWCGEAAVILDDVQYYYMLWFHGADEETLETLLPYFSLEGIKMPNKYYDVYWHTHRTNETLYLHPTGWFGFDDAKVALKEWVQYNPNPSHDELIDHGFFRLINFNPRTYHA